jgi:subtilisin family serine protease
MAKKQQYVLLPQQGVRAQAGESLEILLRVTDAFRTARGVAPLPEGQEVRVLDVVQENGPKLVEADTQTADVINASTAPVRMVPVIEYPKPRLFPWANKPLVNSPAANTHNIEVLVRDGTSQAPVSDANVIAFTDFAGRFGAGGKTGANGKVTLTVETKPLERLYVYSPPGYWGGFRQNVSGSSITVDVEPVDLQYVDCVRYYYGQSNFDPATGVRVGVLDTGCGPHSDLNLIQGFCSVTDEASNDWKDYDIHGTHVAGLIGASNGLRGVAPGVEIMPLRVFPMNGDGATNYAILKALFVAAQNNCDIVNLSLGGGPFDYIVEESIRDARNQGMLLVIAAGNDDRSAVSYPAAYNGAVAVSAMGREGTFPAGSVEEADVLRPPTSQVDPAEFIAAFSNVGQQICVTSPGVGALSTLPNDAYGPLSGTSMASPVAAGAAAALLSKDPAIFGMARNRSRSDAIYNMLVQNCVRRRFGSTFEGFGLPDPATV